MPNGTDSPNPTKAFWSVLTGGIVETASLETLLKWFETAEQKYNMPVPENYPHLPERVLKDWIYKKQKEEVTIKIEDDLYIPELNKVFKTPFELYNFLADNYSFFIPKSDLVPEEDILQKCLDFLKSEDFIIQCEANRLQIEQDKEDYKKRVRKIIVSGDRLRINTEKALLALRADNEPPKIFIRGGLLVRIDFDEDGIPIIKTLDREGVRHVLERAADFNRIIVKRVKDTNGGFTNVFEEIEISPPMDLVKDLMELPAQDFVLPPLTTVIESPTIFRDGTILTERGYNKGTRLFYAPKNGLVVDVKEEVKYTDVVDALNVLNEIFIDFPFDGPASRANCIAALITSVIRPMIRGSIPMVIIDKPVAGTGASLIAEILSIVACGRFGNMMTPPSDDEAWKKSITSLLLKGRAVNIIDNIEGRLYAPSLASVITSNVWEDRILGMSKMVSLPSVSMWVGTGNNIQLAGDIPRRCYWVRMDPKHARPWQRTGYKHENLTQWVDENRGKILSAILTLAKGWISAGSPEPKKVPLMGSFEDWRFVVGGIMEYCGLSEFLGNIETMYEQADVDTPQWDAFCSAWFNIWKGKPVVLNAVFQHLQMESDSSMKSYADEEKLLDALPDTLSDAFYKKKSFTKILGRALASRNNRVMPSGMVILKGDTQQHAVQWIIRPVTDN